MQHPRVLIAVSLLLAGCGTAQVPTLQALPVQATPVQVAQVAAAQAPAKPAVAPYATAVDATPAERIYQAPRDPRILWTWRENEYAWLPHTKWEAKPVFAATVPSDPDVVGLRLYRDGVALADYTDVTPGEEYRTEVPYTKGANYQYKALYAGGHESHYPTVHPDLGDAPRRSRDPRVVKRGTTGMEIEWTTDQPEVGYISWSKAGANAWKPTTGDARPETVHRATISGLDRMTRYTLIAFARRGEDVETGRSNRWTKLFALFGPGAVESDAQMNAD